MGRFPLARVEEMIRAGTIADAPTVAVFGLRGLAGNMDNDRGRDDGRGTQEHR